MPDKWTGNLIGEMHNNRVGYDELAAKLGVGKSYVSMVLNGSRKPADAERRFTEAFREILADRKGSTQEA